MTGSALAAVLALPAGLVLTLLGAALLYRAAPNQLLRPDQPAGRGVARGGWGAALLGLLVLLTWSGQATSVFIWLTALMLVWSLLPLAAAWRAGDRKAPK
ncbi:hypothetical protein [Novosphingobium mangrovi (ex Hu et al. 2023)]|uniref:DUF3325 domain-containing protein n=1 Tax=Novosphingobium mangrovi (ex Hu et al. 2023) TaxID=2930094 RepID=A0ABT0AAJ3_9SPHN|nr:hypothetical protein [Novosphingobium mangrovi (ex Hu et al. 2023)]MCJ1960191.1 hypothetical protein [Novosphingobium mangrovi (ex Hu et al. 2023)]